MKRLAGVTAVLLLAASACFCLPAKAADDAVILRGTRPVVRPASPPAAEAPTTQRPQSGAPLEFACPPGYNCSGMNGEVNTDFNRPEQ